MVCVSLHPPGFLLYIMDTLVEFAYYGNFVWDSCLCHHLKWISRRENGGDLNSNVGLYLPELCVGRTIIPQGCKKAYSLHSSS